MAKGSEDPNEGVGEAQLPTERSESRGNDQEQRKGSLQPAKQPQAAKTNKTSYGRHVYVLCSTCHHPVPLLGSWVQVGAWER